MNKESQFRFERAKKALAAAHRDIKADDPESSITRAYYAMFYLAEALLYSKNIHFRNHGKVHGAFGQNFAKTKELDPKFHKWLLLAFEKRIISDYGLEREELDEDASMIIQWSEEFMKAAEDYLFEVK